MRIDKITLFCLAVAVALFFNGLLIMKLNQLSPKARVVVGIMAYLSTFAMGAIGLFYPK